MGSDSPIPVIARTSMKQPSSSISSPSSSSRGSKSEKLTCSLYSDWLELLEKNPVVLALPLFLLFQKVAWVRLLTSGSLCACIQDRERGVLGRVGDGEAVLDDEREEGSEGKLLELALAARETRPGEEIASQIRGRSDLNVDCSEVDALEGSLSPKVTSDERSWA